MPLLMTTKSTGTTLPQERLKGPAYTLTSMFKSEKALTMFYFPSCIS
ncbi:hypothetical protein SVAN01_08484 [Stagonosporopsis vannaccii]|nr:hypothetical protein SVAN01_08484 [Stagonosporopsis vannaccii]